MKTWWGTYDLPEDNSLKIQVGPLCLGVRNIQDEWQVYYDRDETWQDTTIENKETLIEFVLNIDTLKERYVLQGVKRKVTFSPSLADRSFVTRPSTPFYVPSMQSVIIYISTPLWINIVIGDDSVALTEIPIMRPSDSWFGPNTIRGELCYASRTSARLTVDELPKRFHRAITPIEILNEAESHLLLEKINLPVPYLELYEVAGKYLWTQGVKMTRKEENEAAILEILKGPPVQASDKAVHISEPRKKTMEENIIRTISSNLFS